jgi:hypothetical protein
MDSCNMKWYFSLWKVFIWCLIVFSPYSNNKWSYTLKCYLPSFSLVFLTIQNFWLSARPSVPLRLDNQDSTVINFIVCSDNDITSNQPHSTYPQQPLTISRNCALHVAQQDTFIHLQLSFSNCRHRQIHIKF